MTVVALKDWDLAADMQMTTGSSRLHACKIARLPSGGAIGGAGDAAAVMAGLQFFAAGGSLDGREGKRGLPNIEGAEFLIGLPDGTKWFLADRFPAWEIFDPFAAIGIGSDRANELMRSGLSPVEAIQRVVESDVYCGAPVQSLTIEQPHEFSPVVTHGLPKAKRRK